MSEKTFYLPVRVYYEDTDAGGVVYHARYLHFFERARTEYLRALNFTQQTLLQEQQLAFVVKSLAIDYCVAAKLDDLLTVETDVIEIKGATILFEQRLMRDTVMLSKATVKVASVHLGNMKPVALPKEVKAAFKQPKNKLFGVCNDCRIEFFRSFSKSKYCCSTCNCDFDFILNYFLGNYYST